MATTKDGHDLLINDECVVTITDESEIEYIYKGSWIQDNQQVMCRFESINDTNKRFDLSEHDVKCVVQKIKRG